MSDFEKKVNLSEKSLKNIRGYLWLKKRWRQDWYSKSRDSKKRFLERRKQIKKNNKRKKFSRRNFKFL